MRSRIGQSKKDRKRSFCLFSKCACAIAMYFVLTLFSMYHMEEEITQIIALEVSVLLNYLCSI